MRRLFNLFRSPVPQFSSDQEIQDEQFLDKDGRAHMDTYLSFYSAPVSTDERHWEQAHGPERYEGGLKSFDVKPGIKRIGVRAFS